MKKQVVAIGGGHGLSVSLRALRHLTDRLTAVVSVADDGGSSGRLRQDLGIPAPGDIRRCLVALGDPNSIWTKSFDTRFEQGELKGHAFGNLVIGGLTQFSGDFVAALDEVGALLGVAGRVLPATTTPVVLKALTASQLGTAVEVQGQVAVGRSSRIATVSLEPAKPPVPEPVVRAIMGADVIVLGPGSLFTSVLAACVVPGIRAALGETRARLVYVANLWPQESETTGFDVAAHVESLNAHGIEPDSVVYDSRSIAVGRLSIPGFAANLANSDGTAHDPERLADVLAGLVG